MSITIDQYIKKSLIQKTILLFLISLIPLTLVVLYSYENEYEASAQKAKLAFESTQSVIMTKIDALIKQIAHTNRLRLFLQSSELSQNQDKYKVLTSVEMLLLHHTTIDGIELYTNDNKQILHNGKTSDLPIIYDLNYTNDFIDQYGEKLGYLKVYLDKHAILAQLDTNYYDIELNATDGIPLLNFNKLKTNLIHIMDNQIVKIIPKHVFSMQWLNFIVALTSLFFAYLFIAKRTFDKIIRPIKRIEHSIFNSHVESNLPDNDIRELVWISKIISNIKTSKHHMKNKLISLYTKNNEFTVNSLHYLKSSLTSSKLIVDEELKEHPAYNDLNSNILQTITKVANAINKFKSANESFDDHEAVLTSVNKIEYLIKNELRKYSSISIELIFNKINIDVNTFIPLSKKQLTHSTANILANAIESGANKVLVTINYNGQRLDITFENNGASIDINKAECYISGNTSKVNGTGTGLSSINKLLVNNNSQIYFSVPSFNYNTKLTLDINCINNKLSDIIDYIRSKVILSEIIIFNQPRSVLPHEIESDLIITKIMHEKDLLEYIELSKKSGIIENQLYIHDHLVYASLKGSKYLKIILDTHGNIKQLI
ncbi:MAG: hypothetical protein KBD25_00420 [Rickettsiaceae bacterium]|nr:hypothetical protein [Rickettsiaceae bacterium]